MIPLLFAVAMLAQAPPVAQQEGPPAHLQFHALPEGMPDPGPWPGGDVGFEDLEVRTDSPATPYLQHKRVCKAEALCVLEGRFEHSVTEDLAEHVDRYILIGSAGRLEGYAYQRGRGSKPRYFILDRVSDRTASGGRTGHMWREIKSDDAEHESQGLLYGSLSRLLSGK